MANTTAARPPQVSDAQAAANAAFGRARLQAILHRQGLAEYAGMLHKSGLRTDEDLARVSAADDLPEQLPESAKIQLELHAANVRQALKMPAPPLASADQAPKPDAERITNEVHDEQRGQGAPHFWAPAI